MVRCSDWSSDRRPARGKVLPCNNTPIFTVRLINHERCRAMLPGTAIRPILAAMSEEDDLARRFFALWTEYLTALVADPKMTEPLRRWLAMIGDGVSGSPAGAAPADAGIGAPPRSSPGPSAAAA